MGHDLCAFGAILVLGIAACTIGGCSRKPEPGGSQASPTQALTVSSPAFAAGAAIPKKHTGDGADTSPHIQWSGVPVSAKSVALICDDPDAPAGTWVHWVLYDLPPSASDLAEGQPTTPSLSSGARQGVNDFGRSGYGGPAPPRGPAHRYYFRVYALDKPTGLAAGASRADLDKAMEGHVLAKGEAMGTYQRP